MSPRTRLVAVVAVLALALALPPASASGASAASPASASPGSASPGSASPGSASPGSASPGSASPASADRAAALAALARVDGLFSTSPSLRRVAAGSHPDATLALRDLSLVVDDLPAAERQQARAYFRRPTLAGGDGTLNYGSANVERSCGGVVCVHYATEGGHRPDLTDGNGNGVPDYVDTALATLTHVHATYVRAGYKRPRGDGARGGGGTNRVDVYLGDVDSRGLYGYCTTDEVRNGYPYSRWAYCVLDDDYANIPTNTPLENLRVTAAHEYFHAVQYAYDYGEDAWFLEATAAWVEDEMYDSVDDNRQYLRRSPLRLPRRPMDQFRTDDLWHYGVWIFFRYLTERYPAGAAGLPTLVRDMWRRADGTTTPQRDQYSWQAVNSVLRARGSSAAAAFAAFSAGNRRPRATYEEGASQRYPTAPLWAGATLTGSRRSAARAVELDHLASATARFAPQGLAASDWKLRLRLDLAPTARGSRVVVVVTAASGRVRRVPVALDRAGNGVRTVAFSTRSVRHVEVTLVNAGGRYRCFVGTRFSCQGAPLDDNLTQRVRATAYR